MVARTSTCLRRLAGGRRSGIVGFSRFLANPRVTVEALLDGWGAELSQSCAGRHILAIQDTSEFNFTTTKERSRGLGEIGKGLGRGVLLHAMLGVDAETGGILGLATGRIWTRDGRVSVHHRNRPLSEKESQRWLSTAEAAKTVLHQAQMVTEISDRESIRYEQEVFLTQIRSPFTSALAVSSSLRMIAMIATLAGFPPWRSAAYLVLRSGLKRMATKAGM